MKLSAIAVLLLAAANSVYADYDRVAIKEKKIEQEVKKAAANLEAAEHALEKKQKAIRGAKTHISMGNDAKTDEMADNDEVEYLNGTPLKPHCPTDRCPRKYAAFKKALHDYDIEQMKDYDANPVNYVNGIPMKEKCDPNKGDEHEKRKCAHRHQAFDKAEEKFEEASFKGRHVGPPKDKPEGGRGPSDGKTEGRGPQGDKAAGGRRAPDGKTEGGRGPPYAPGVKAAVGRESRGGKPNGRGKH